MNEGPFRLGIPIPATPAATVLLLRDGAQGVEVFMLQRHLDSDFVGGAFVFPGGKVDPMDRNMPAESIIGPTRDDGDFDDGDFRVAAIRETFEECGVLLARRDGRPVEAEELAETEFVEARRRLSNRTDSWDWRPWLIDRNLALDLSSLAWWSWWVTPEGVHRRFDTRFYVAVAPDGHLAAHDDIETTASRWMTPHQALAAAAAGEASIILPTRKNLTQLERYPTAQAALGAARADSFARPRIQPHIVEDENGAIKVSHSSFPEPELP